MIQIRSILFLVVLQFSCLCFCQNLQKTNKAIDSLLYICRNSDREAGERLSLALQAQEMANNLAVDSIKVKVGRTLALMYLENDDLVNYSKANSDYLELAIKINDSFAITSASANLGSYYRFMQENDTAFYFLNNALKYYGDNEYSISKAETLYLIADIQHVAKIYEGAEVDAIRALEVLERIDRSERTLDAFWGVYNLLAIIASDLGNYDQAIEYYEKSLNYADQLQDALINEVYTLNNIAETYRLQGKFEEALIRFEDLAKRRKEYDAIDPTFFGTLKNNIALTKIDIGNYDFKDVEAQLKKARSIAYDFEDENGKVMTSLHLSKLYLENNLNDSVLKYSNEALKLADEFSSNEAKQRALFLLSEVTPGEAGKHYLKEHIRLGDSLEAEERVVRNKIARIKFDTDQIQARNEQISRENFYLILVSIGLLLTGVLVYVIVSQRARNKELRLKQIQQEANEEIYNLMLKQQDKIEEARSNEKTRVSKELHDGVLGRLFGVRLSLDSLNFSEGKEAVTSRSNYIGQLKGIEEDIRKISHEMNTDFVAGSGFVDVLQELVDNQSQAYGLEAEFTTASNINWDQVSNKVKINLYRIVQESMQNVYKHAQATQVKIAISLINNDICLEVKDNGKGFDTARQRRGIGLKNITSRVEDLKGTVSFKSQVGKGTTVKTLIPQ